jgi:hypothetical protein
MEDQPVPDGLFDGDIAISVEELAALIHDPDGALPFIVPIVPDDFLDLVPTPEGGVAYIDANGLFWINGVLAPFGANLTGPNYELIAARLSMSGQCAVFFFVNRGGIVDGVVDAVLVTPTGVWDIDTGLNENNISELSHNIVVDENGDNCVVAFVPPFECEIHILDFVTRTTHVVEVIPEDDLGDPNAVGYPRLMCSNMDPTSTRMCIRIVSALEGDEYARGTGHIGDERIVVITLVLQENGAYNMVYTDLPFPYGIGDVDIQKLVTHISPDGFAFGGVPVDSEDGNARAFDPNGRCILHLAPEAGDFYSGCVFLPDSLLAVWSLRGRLTVRTLRNIIFSETIAEDSAVVVNGRNMLVISDNALPRLYALPPCSRRDMMRTAILCARRLQSLQRMRYVNEDIWVYIFNTFFA